MRTGTEGPKFGHVIPVQTDDLLIDATYGEDFGGATGNESSDNGFCAARVSCAGYQPSAPTPRSCLLALRLASQVSVADEFAQFWRTVTVRSGDLNGRGPKQIFFGAT